MMRKILLSIMTLSLTFLTGCWDRVEINDLALVLASGFDLTKDGQLEITEQIALPSGIGMPGAGGGRRGTKNSSCKIGDR